MSSNQFINSVFAQPTQNKDAFAARRQKLLASMPANSMLIVPGAKTKPRNKDNDYVFRQESSFYYLTGLEEDEAIAVFIPNRKEGEFILFTKAHNPIHEAFVGEYIGTEGAIATYGANQAFTTESFKEEFPKLLGNNITNISYTFIPDGDFSDLKHFIDDYVLQQYIQVKYGRRPAVTISPTDILIDQLRMIKDENEIALINRAVQISEKAHLTAMQACRPEIREMKLSRKIMDVFMDNGSQEVAYPNIVGAGENSCTLHYEVSKSVAHENDIVLIDAGVEYEKYASDITRTFPANGKFSPEQRAVYEVVLAAQQAVIGIVKPGVTWKELGDLAAEKITEGLLKLGLLKGDLKELIESKAYKTFYMHSIGHFLGLDVHDVGDYDKPLAPGVVLTIEPGIYINKNIEGIDPRWHNIGVRIEDNLLVTETGCEVLSRHLPKDPDLIEKTMQGFVPEEMIKIGYKAKSAFFKTEAENSNVDSMLEMSLRV